ncbi:MAG TPA: HAMP domain-containing sensor histidine kinase [Bradyrhizobium sp.]|nr:HAMP domain-containing sensor histidine kinase [Bradyrhizobium sp.]
MLEDGSVKIFTDGDPEAGMVVEDLASTLRELDGLMPQIDRPGIAEHVLGRLSPLEAKLARFAGDANTYGAERVADDQRQLLELHWAFSGLAAGLAVCGLSLIGLLLIQNRLISAAHVELHSMADDLKIAKELAEAASEAKSRFLAAMSHELRTPLNAIIGFSELIADEKFGPIGQPRYLDYATNVVASGRHMSDLVNDILTTAKLDAGQYELNSELVDVRHLVAATITMIGGADIAKDREIVIDPDSEWFCLFADERSVKQMLLNLISNALKFSAVETPVQITSRRAHDGELWVTVTDHGIGMTSEQAAAAIKPFHQIDNRLSRRYEGTGLGLTIVKSMMECHGGRLVVRSEAGKGSQISLVFPARLRRSGRLAEVA